MKENNIYAVKSLDLKVEDIDISSRKVVAYGSAFNIMDSDFDIIRKGAFSKSIQERGANSTGNRKIAHLRNHSWDVQIGKITEIYEDDYGLKFVSELGRSTAGDDALKDYQDGILREHSIGFNYITDKMKFVENDTQDYYEINEVKLWEVSGVTFGANEFTQVIDVAKGWTAESYLSKLNEQMNTYIKVLKSGSQSDERLYEIEMGLKVLQQKYNSLIISEPTVKVTIEDEPNKLSESKQFYLNLNLLKK